MDEFSFINKYLKPLAVNFQGSLNLSDDAAVFSPPSGCELVITKDAITEGVHFLGSESPALIAAKALRVNLSDLASMGATPLCYFMSLVLPRTTSEQWLEKFAAGLGTTQAEFSIALAGGDTTANDGKLSISITAIGTVPQGTALKRSGARTGDDIYVSGTLGDSALGLELLKNMSCQTQVFSKSGAIGIEKLSDVASSNNPLINRYLIPQPRIDLGIKLRTVATSCMDISDGLAQDLSHICTASNVGATIYTDKLPTTDIQKALSGGDDYELLFTTHPDKKPQIEELSKSLQLPLTRIGEITAGNRVSILDESGTVIKLSKNGFKHF